MFDRVSDTVNLFLLRMVEWVDDLSPIGKAILFGALIAGIGIAEHFGLIPNRWGQRQCFFCK